ncbi:MAG: hypothetical protein ACKVP7_25090 [Hyphomicrobiaceae bacterium]
MRCSAIRALTASTLALALALTVAPRAQAQPVAVDVTSASEPVLCAEKDNVTLNFAAADVRRFRIEAAHPSYIGTLQRDSFEADWTACDMSGDPAHRSEVKAPTRRTLYEEPALWVVGWTMPTFWRPATATVRIGDRVEKGLHLVQVWMIRPMGGEEVLVFYPQDGYWRLRPLAPEGRAPTAFGSSFLLGPVEIEGRPIVKLKEIAFDPPARTFTLAFERGGSATLKMAVVDQNRHTLDVAFDKAISGRPFAALRSMFITDFNNDVARVAVREKGAKGWREEPIMGFKRAQATDVWAGRTSVSRHNTSSPDMVFSAFAAGEAPAVPGVAKKP